MKMERIYYEKALRREQELVLRLLSPDCTKADILAAFNTPGIEPWQRGFNVSISVI